MKWLMVLVAIVLGGAITWLLTVRRATRQVAPDEAAGFGGSVTHESSSRMGWDRTALDEDALLRRDPRPRDLEATDVLPIAGATPNGDLAGVTAPRADAGPPPTAADAGPPPTPADEVPTAQTTGPERDAGQPGGGGPSAKDQET